MSTPEEMFRKTMRGRTPEGEPTTLIVTRQGMGRAGRTWLTFDGGIKTTVVLTDQEAAELGGLLGDASSARGPR
jgi:biotin-(acetyl-CoA carboxylase) ligase